MNFQQQLHYVLSNLLLEAQSVSDEKWVEVLKNSKNFSRQEESDDELYGYVKTIKGYIPNNNMHQKYAPYWLAQIANGNLRFGKLDEDAPRLINTIEGFVKLSRKSNWDGSKNIYDWKNWKLLEQKVTENKNADIEYNKDKDSIILFSKMYVNENSEELFKLLGITTQPNYSKYWLRQIITCAGAYKYGRGTQWCTAVNPNEFTTARHPAVSYISKGLFIIERETSKSPRRPIVQMSGTGDVMQMNDFALIPRANLAKFIGECVNVFRQKSSEVEQPNKSIYHNMANILS